MAFQILYIILALLGISFLIFIHELGHYFAALRAGIRVEVFSIGFGKPIVEWERKGVKWRICWLPFGGYVKMAGMEKQGPLEPHQIEGGFFAKRPWDRMKVAFMGPFVNIVFAFVAFTMIWMSGGREKPFAETTSYIGWVDPESKPYEDEIRPGDQILELNGKTFTSFNQFLQSAALDRSALSMKGKEIDYWSGESTPFTFTFDHPDNLDGVVKATQIASMLNPAQYLIVDRIHEGSPLANSGIEKGDRVVWVNGELIFSNRQLMGLLNNNSALLTVEREGKTFLSRVPTVKIWNLRLTSAEKGELDDWSYARNLKPRFENLFYIPYNLTSDAVVENPWSYVDENSELNSYFNPAQRISAQIPLVTGDRILAVNGNPVHSGQDLLQQVQTPKALMIVERAEKKQLIGASEGDKTFIHSFDVPDLETLIQSIGSGQLQREKGNFTLLEPVTPLPISSFPMSDVQRKINEETLAKQKKAIEEIAVPEQKQQAEKLLEFHQNRKALGVAFTDMKVVYNPPPQVLFADTFKEIYRTLGALVTGFLNPKHLAGPVGIVQVIHHGWSLGFNEALYWLGMISLNLGLLNLLPIPMLDGGYIVFSLWETITRKRIKAKTMERMIIPFVVLLIAAFIYMTYNDILRIFKNFF